MNFISRKIINKYFLIPLYFRFFNNIKLNSLFYIIVIIIYLFGKTKTLIWFSAENFQNWLLRHMCYCLMKNVLNSFEFTFATCKDMLMRMLLLTKSLANLAKSSPFITHLTNSTFDHHPMRHNPMCLVGQLQVSFFPTQSGKVKSMLGTKLTRINSWTPLFLKERFRKY